ncbi:MAG TPA: hypothetical protein VFB96_16330, partial [Pirellulaceae bacterium]|nr:hypothetical protein [Pirellulaceae bacterium]
SQEKKTMDYRNDYDRETEVATWQDDEPLRPLSDVLEYLRQYAREKPEVVALTCFGIGFVLGWKLKPW